jgi:hypothetical protein
MDKLVFDTKCYRVIARKLTFMKVLGGKSDILLAVPPYDVQRPSARVSSDASRPNRFIFLAREVKQGIFTLLSAPLAYKLRFPSTGWFEVM